MCGICGVLWRDGRPVDRDELSRMVATLNHRGPDDNGIYTAGGVGLGHARLSIIDLSAAGHQPMQSADGRHVIVFNGEIYNFAELRVELQRHGYGFVSRSDTEVVLYALIHWGRDALLRFNGMFALALWDREDRRLLLARDRFGIKPLFYASDAGRLLFGSEYKAIAAASGHVAGAVDGQGLAEFLSFGNSLGTRTLSRDVRRLLPGHWLEVGPSGEQVGRYWSVGMSGAAAVGEQEAIAGVRQRLELAVRRQLVSDVPVGVFLSGGVDSTAIVAAATRAGAGRIRTYTVRFDFASNDADVVAARQVAAQFGTDHQELEVSGYRLEDILEAVAVCHDFPFSDAANIPLYLLTQALHGDVKVVLQGDGGDELFAGYRRYALLERLALLGPLARLAAPLVAALPQGTAVARLSRMAWALGARDPAERMARLLTEDKPDCLPGSLLSADWRQRLAPVDPIQRYRECWQTHSGLDPVQAMLYTDCEVLLPDIFLEKVDRSTMAHSVEVRVPMLDHDLADFALSLPASFKVRRGQLKWVLKQAMAELVPEFVLRRPKAGFGVPYAQWLRGPLKEYLRAHLLDPGTVPDLVFDRTLLARRVDEHLAGERNHGFLLWKALQLAVWQRRQAH